MEHFGAATIEASGGIKYEWLLIKWTGFQRERDESRKEPGTSKCVEFGAAAVERQIKFCLREPSLGRGDIDEIEDGLRIAGKAVQERVCKQTIVL